MASSGYVWSNALERRTARPHDASGRPLQKARPTATDAARYAAAGGLQTTASDYARLLLEVIAPRPGDTFRLGAVMHAEMLRPQVQVDATKSWALGWEIQHTPAGDLIQHQGGQRGFQAFTAASLERRSGYVILTNSDNGWKVYFDPAFVDLTNRLLFA